MDMYEDRIVLCAANSYEEKYYLNPDFEELPDDVKNELKIMCVLYVHDGGVSCRFSNSWQYGMLVCGKGVKECFWSNANVAAFLR